MSFKEGGLFVSRFRNPEPEKPARKQQRVYKPEEWKEKVRNSLRKKVAFGRVAREKGGWKRDQYTADGFCIRKEV